MAEYDELVKRLKDAAHSGHTKSCPARSGSACTCGWNVSLMAALAKRCSSHPLPPTPTT